MATTWPPYLGYYRHLSASPVTWLAPPQSATYHLCATPVTWMAPQQSATCHPRASVNTSLQLSGSRHRFIRKLTEFAGNLEEAKTVLICTEKKN